MEPQKFKGLKRPLIISRNLNPLKRKRLSQPPNIEKIPLNAQRNNVNFRVKTEKPNKQEIFTPDDPSATFLTTETHVDCEPLSFSSRAANKNYPNKQEKNRNFTQKPQQKTQFLSKSSTEISRRNVANFQKLSQNQKNNQNYLSIQKQNKSLSQPQPLPIPAKKPRSSTTRTQIKKTNTTLLRKSKSPSRFQTQQQRNNNISLKNQKQTFVPTPTFRSNQQHPSQLPPLPQNLRPFSSSNRSTAPNLERNNINNHHNVPDLTPVHPPPPAFTQSPPRLEHTSRQSRPPPPPSKSNLLSSHPSPSFANNFPSNHPKELPSSNQKIPPIPQSIAKKSKSQSGFEPVSPTPSAPQVLESFKILGQFYASTTPLLWEHRLLSAHRKFFLNIFKRFTDERILRIPNTGGNDFVYYESLDTTKSWEECSEKEKKKRFDFIYRIISQTNTDQHAFICDAALWEGYELDSKQRVFAPKKRRQRWKEGKKNRSMPIPNNMNIKKEKKMQSNKSKETQQYDVEEALSYAYGQKPVPYRRSYKKNQNRTMGVTTRSQARDKLAVKKEPERALPTFEQTRMQPSFSNSLPFNLEDLVRMGGTGGGANGFGL